jgi:hypothetical protein
LGASALYAVLRKKKQKSILLVHTNNRFCFQYLDDIEKDENENSPVNIVLTVNIFHNQPRIIFQLKWTLPDEFEPPHNTRSFVTSEQAKEEAVLSYSGGLETVAVSFSISFETLLKRPPNPERPIEGDFHFTRRGFDGDCK